MQVAAARDGLRRWLTAVSWGAPQQTGGSYTVALDERHLEELVRQHAPPPPTAATSTAASMVSAPASQKRLAYSTGSHLTTSSLFPRKVDS